jgi:hypothetical protein
LRIAIVYAGDREVHCPATRENNRFGAVFAAFAARGVEAQPAVHNLAQLKALGAQWQSARFGPEVRRSGRFSFGSFKAV